MGLCSIRFLWLVGEEVAQRDVEGLSQQTQGNQMHCLGRIGPVAPDQGPVQARAALQFSNRHVLRLGQFS